MKAFKRKFETKITQLANIQVEIKVQKTNFKDLKQHNKNQQRLEKITFSKKKINKCQRDFNTKNNVKARVEKKK